MIHLKNIFQFVIVLACISIIIFDTSCKNKCGSTTCQNGGTCVNNICSCPTGYSGNSCQTSWDGPIIGTYTCTRSDCHPSIINTGAWTSVVTVGSTNGGYTMNISNFNSSNTTVAATVDTYYNVNLVASNGIGVSGNGKFNTTTNVLTLTFKTFDSSGFTGYTCDMAMVKE